MSKIDSILNSLLSRSSSIDPIYRDIFQEIANELRRIGTIVDPIPIVASKVSQAKGTNPSDVQTFSYSTTGTNLVLTWLAPEDSILLYEIRKGSDWDTASLVLVTGTLTAFLDPILIGTSTYLIKALNEFGLYSVNPNSISVVIPPLGSVIISSSQLNNQAIISWSAPSSTFNIKNYQVTRNGSNYASLSDRFLIITELLAASYTYGVYPIDIAGNVGPSNSVTINLTSPTDFDFVQTQTSNFSGTKTNCKSLNSILYACINTSETIKQHFDNNSWLSPQEQVSAGYTRWLSPNSATATYEEVFDFSSILSNVIVNLSWIFDLLAGSFTFGLSTKVSDDNITYSTAYTDSSFFVTSVRYVKAKFTFTGSNDKALLAFHDFMVTLAVKREVDGGNASVLAADASGTVINFNKAFKLVESITVTVLNTAVRTYTYDFAGGVSPSSFKVKVWDSTGTRVDAIVSWKARGIL